MRVFSLLVRVALVLVPLVLLGYRGTLYVWKTALFLLAPGVPVRIEVKTPGGSLVAEADGYAIDPKAGTAWLRGLVVTDPQGVVIAKIKEAEADGLDAFRGADQIVKVRLTDVYGRVERDKKGFDFQQYLPKPSGQPGTVPYVVEVFRARATFVDRTKGAPWKRELATDYVRVAGLGDDVTGHATVRAEGIGKVPIQVQQTPLGVSVLGDLPPLDVSDLVRRFVETPALKEVRWKSLVVGGPVRAWIPKTGYRFETSLAAQVTGLAYRDYRAESARFEGTVNDKGVVGTVQARESDTRATFEGSALFEPFSVGGRLVANVASREAVPESLRSQIPAAAGFRDAKFQGWVAGSRVEDFEVSGHLVAASAAYGADSVRNLSVTLRGDRSRLLVSLPRTVVRGIPLSGVGSLDLRGNRAVAAIRTESFDLARLPVKGLTGTGKADASLTGPLNDPSVRFTVHAQGGYGRYSVPDLDAAGIWTKRGFVVTRGFARGLGGIAAITGNVSPTGGLDLHATVRSLRLGTIDRRLNGSVSAEARVVGTIRDPRVYGRVETYLASWQGETIPAASARFSADMKGARIADLYALRGTGVATGAASLRFADGRLKGHFAAQDIQAGDFIGESVVGTISVPELTLDGTLAKPILTGKLEGDDLVVRGIKIDDFTASVDTDEAGAFRLQGASAKLLGGTVTSRGVYDPQARSGALDIEAKGLELSPLAAELAPGSTLDGTASLKIEATLAGGQVAAANGDASFQNVRFNGELLGNGAADAKLEGNVVTGNAEVGQINRYVRVSEVAVDRNAKTVQGDVEASNLSVKSLVAIGLPYANEIDYQTERDLRSLDGGVFLAAHVSGDLDRPDVNVETLEARNVTYGEKPLGTLTASGDYTDGNARVAALNIEGPIGSLRGQGRLAESGTLLAEIDPIRIDLARLGDVIPALAGKTGTVDASFTVGGTRDEPTLRGTLNGQHILANQSQKEGRGLRVDLDTISASAKDGVDVEGSFFYRGFQGKLAATTTAPALFGESAPRPTEATLTLSRRPLAEIASLMDGLDPKRTTGDIGGVAVLKQAPGGVAQLSGRIEAKGELAFQGVPDTLKDLDSSLTLKGTQLVFMLNGMPSKGGSVASSAILELGNPTDFVSDFAKGGVASILTRSLDAKVDLKDVLVKQNFPKDPNAFLSGGSLNGAINGTLTAKGPLSGPLIAGNLSVGGVDTQVPTLQPKTGGSGQILVDPKFDLRIALANPARVRSATADLQLLGGGKITGQLSALDVNSRLSVEKGTIRLPGGLVRLEQGGTIDVTYDGRSNQDAEAQVNLEGRTGVTAQSSAGTIQRYDIHLTVRGDLLKDGGLVLNATSDPSDLSQERILSLLGATDALSVLNTGTSQSQAESQVRDALIGFALPSLLDPFTGQLAKTFGLEYLTVEYNPFERASLVFGRALNGDFSVQGRRQLQSLPGQPVRYDIRLIYRPRKARGLLSRVSFSVGADETRPLKFAIEYSVRF
ncbi:hypothetical protein BH11ARM2_BH11ARM2_02990 [soil metagenome]